MNELHKITGADEATLRAILGRLDMVAGNMALAREVVASFRPCGTATAAQTSLSIARGELEAARGALMAALAPAKWCDGCGDGATGKCRDWRGNDFACPKCGTHDEGFA